MRQTVRIDDEYELRYDALVYALGSVADTESVPGVDEFAYTLDSADEAATLAAQLDRLGNATVVVAGGGLTGVESAAEIAEQHPDADVILLSRDEPGSMMGAKARARLHAGLARLGVHVRAGADIVKVMADGVALADGEVVAAQAVLWTTGVRVSPLAATAGSAGRWPRPHHHRRIAAFGVASRTSMPSAMRRRSGKATASCTARARAAYRPPCTLPLRSCVS